jgi:hypothetical protein
VYFPGYMRAHYRKASAFRAMRDFSNAYKEYKKSLELSSTEQDRRQVKAVQTWLEICNARVQDCEDNHVCLSRWRTRSLHWRKNAANTRRICVPALAKLVMISVRNQIRAPNTDGTLMREMRMRRQKTAVSMGGEAHTVAGHVDTHTHRRHIRHKHIHTMR